MISAARRSFLSALPAAAASYDFSGKKILPFCTSGGSGVGRSDTALHKDVSGSVKWEKGVQINRPDEAKSRRWLKDVL